MPNKDKLDQALPFFALHGFTGEGADYSALSSFVGGSWQCPDLPGHGLHSGASAEDFSFPALEKRFLFPMQGNRIGVGYSLGGRLLLHLALRNPAVFERLIFISSSPGLKTLEEREARVASDKEWIRFLQKESLSDFLDRWLNQPILSYTKTLSSQDLATIIKRRSKNKAAGLIHSLEYQGTGTLPSLWEKLPALEVPALILVGERDEKFQKIGSEMVRLMPKARLSIIPNSGHAPHLEAPERCAAEIEAFAQ